MSQKPLLLFAHRGEAQAFLGQAVSVSSSLQAYETPHYLLLVTQEGIQETTENLTWFLAEKKDQVSLIINLGVAGALQSNLNLDQIYKIKTIYAEEQFKSFSTGSDGLDLITAKTRVSNAELAKKLSITAPIVDREAWAMASVAKKFKKNFNCYKLISDFAGANGEENFCEMVKEKAQIYSEKLYQHFLTLNFVSLEKPNLHFDLPGFHFTFTQQKQYEILIERLQLKGISDHSALIGKINQLKLTPKEKSQELIQELTFILNPFKKEFEQKLGTVTLPLTQIGCRLKFTEHYENKHFTLSMPIENEKNLVNLQNALKEISYHEISKILDGEF